MVCFTCVCVCVVERKCALNSIPEIVEKANSSLVVVSVAAKATCAAALLMPNINVNECEISTLP